MWLCVTVCGSVWLCVVVYVRQGGVHGHPKAWAGMPGVWLWGSGSALGIFLGPFPTHDHIGLPPSFASLRTQTKQTDIDVEFGYFALCSVPCWDLRSPLVYLGGFSRGGSICGQSRDRSHNSSTPGMRRVRAGQTLPAAVVSNSATAAECYSCSGFRLQTCIQ